MDAGIGVVTAVVLVVGEGHRLGLFERVGFRHFGVACQRVKVEPTTSVGVDRLVLLLDVGIWAVRHGAGRRGLAGHTEVLPGGSPG